MAKMKAVQPEMTAIRERYGDDKVKQQQALMELYKKEKINPLAGCLPIVIQVPVFFSLYKVLFISIEMRHAPFFGWIKDLSAPDPTNLFNLFGLLPYDPTLMPVFGHFLHLGVWPIDHGHHDVVPDEAQSVAAGPDAEDDLRLDAADLHLHAGVVLGRAGDLLGLEQHAVGDRSSPSSCTGTAPRSCCSTTSRRCSPRRKTARRKGDVQRIVLSTSWPGLSRPFSLQRDACNRPHAAGALRSNASRTMGPPHPSRRGLRPLLRIRRAKASRRRRAR